jgi:hypothetical protein
MSWDEFTNALQQTLPKITERCYLIIAGPEDEGGYVQFFADKDTLHAEAAAPQFVSAKAEHDVDNPELLAAGWQAPTALDFNWHQSLPLPALSTEFAALAARCCVALRDVYQLKPTDLEYKAWREPEEQPPGVTWQQEQFDQLDPGEKSMAHPTLGLPQMSNR